MNLLLQHGLIHNKNGFVAADILIVDGMIQQIAHHITHPDAKLINCTGKHIIPGLIDAHVHFRDPGATHKEDFLSGSKAAAAGGVTTVLDMPNNSPPTTTQERLHQKRELAKKSIVNYGLYLLGCVENKDDLHQFLSVPGIKVYLGSSTGNYLTDDLGVFVQILENARVPVVAHAENEQLIKHFTEKFKESQLHHKMRDNLCAAVGIAESTIAATHLQQQLHIAHMSTAEEVNFLRRNKTPNISCEVCPHHLFLNEQFFLKQQNYGKMNPPLRYQKDQDALWEGIADGLIDCVATDHAPHTKDEKNQSFWDAPCGVPGVQTMLPLLLNAVHERKLSLMDVVRLTSTNPSRIFHIEKRGALQPGYHADICIVDMQQNSVITNERQHSKCGWTPFHGLSVKGSIVMTLVNGQVVYDGQVYPTAVGREVTFGRATKNV
jgi:dihydroorotase